MSQQNGGQFQILIATGAYAPIDPMVHQNHFDFFMREFRGLGPGYALDVGTWGRTPLQQFRMEAAHAVLKENFDAVFFLDDDLLVIPFPIGEPTVLKRMSDEIQEGRADVVCGLVHIRRAPFYPMTFKRHPEEENKYNPFVGKEDYEVDACHLAFTLVSRRALEWHRDKVGEMSMFNARTPNSDDITFCQDVQEAGGTIKALVDVKTYHLGEPLRIGWELFQQQLKSGQFPHKEQDRSAIWTP